MNMLYEGLKTNATIVVVPSTAVETMGLGGLAGTVALADVVKKDMAGKSKYTPPRVSED